MEYEQLLERARKNMPKEVFERQRFEIPKLTGHLEGNKTILTNFIQIATTLRRPPEHLLKYALKELATPGEIKNERVIIGSKVPASRINEKIRQYANEFVLCPKCGKPDTDILKEADFAIMKCSACGTRTHVKSKI
ncbi:translation initiation factor IF-2 subunit beta [Candidatus Woesearchaeota archaeon]|nr:translation initiation factor IF-2 subunit beta [Candidatus Woesearchaeota archaeon]